MTKRILACIGFGAAFLLAEDPVIPLQVSHTQHAELPSGGTLRVVNSTGNLTVVAWDQPGVDITIIKPLTPGYTAGDRDRATHELDSLKIKAEHRGDELVVTTDSPRYLNSDIEYYIKAPRTTKLIAHHRAGEVNVDGLTSDIQVTLGRGDIVLHLPQDNQYNTEAKVDIGTVNTDYSGQVARFRLCGHRVETGNAPTLHNLNLKVGYGDIVILKTNIPKPPEPKANGL